MALADKAMLQVPLLPAQPGDVLDEEIPLDQLIQFDDDGLPIDLIDEQELGIGQQEREEGDQDGPQNRNLVLNVGMVLVNQTGPDPAFADWERRRTVEATRIWASFFSPGRPSTLQVSIPTEWANLFTVLLMSPDKFS